MSIYIDKVMIVKRDGGFLSLEGENVNDETLETIKKFWDGNEVARIELENIDDCKTMVIFTNNKLFHVGIVDMFDEENSYMDNGSEETELVEIDGNVFEKRFIHTNKDGVWKVLEEFYATGEKASQVEWCVE